jgi:hypothetical protein
VVICGFHFDARFTSYRLVGLLINIRNMHADINAYMPLTPTPTHIYICNIYLYMFT